MPLFCSILGVWYNRCMEVCMLGLDMNRINKYNIISSEELNYLLPVDES